MLTVLYVCLILVRLAAGPAAAGPLDPPAGYAKAFTCSACHGVGGNSKGETVPISRACPPRT